MSPGPERMQPDAAASRRPGRALIGLAIGAAGGAAAAALGTPLPWLLGALIATALVGLAGLPLAVPVRARQTGQVVVGCAVGLYFTAPVAAEVAAYGLHMVGVGIVSILAGAGLALVLARAAGVDRKTAYFASLPGGVAEMAVLAERHGGDAALVALAQSLRIVCVVLVVPPTLTVLGVTGTQSADTLALPVRAPALIAMLALAGLLAVALDRARVTNPWLLGGLCVGVAVALSGLPGSRVPSWGVDAAQVLIGAALGARFGRGVLVRLRVFAACAAAGTLTLIAFGALLAWLLSAATGLPVATLVLAAAPGGVAEMSITAKVLGLGVPLVTAFHVVRIVLIILVSEPLFVLARRLAARRSRRDGNRARGEADGPRS
ncbi:AbrB family transcriptional regulator [Salinarimonas sp.]|uniref:AbrB family transcriptional regulator n=1 Tax=Salinarimonas sp. TaxID=2766526 RepID=UPI0032D8CBA7